MTYRKRFQISLALAFVLGCGVGYLGVAPSPVQAADAAKNSVSRKFAKPFQDAQAAMTAKNYDAAIQVLRSNVESATDRTPYDTFVMNQLLGLSLAQSKQNAAAIPYLEGMVGSGFLEPSDAQLYSREIVKLYYGEKDYAKAAEAGHKLIEAGTANDDVYVVVAQAEFLQKNFPAVATVLGPYVKQATSAGGKPPEPVLQLLSESYIRQNDMASAAGPLRLLVTHYPSPQHWSNLLTIQRVGAGSDVALLNVYRLMHAVGALTEPNDVSEMVELAIKLGSPGEALTVLQEAMAKDVFKTDSAKKSAEGRLQRVTTLSATDKGGLASFEKEASAAKTGEGDVRLGQALLSYGQADKAIDALKRGIGKGSLRNPDEAQILLGMALLKAGRKDDAIVAFNGAKGADPKLTDIAGLWALHARS